MAFECVECGYSDSKWLGRCPRCNEWDTFVETGKFEEKPAKCKDILDTKAQNLSDVETSRRDRVKTGFEGFDRLLGGGIVEGEVILFGGPPGVGKSTMFLHLADKLGKAGYKVLFVSGEVNPRQLKIHADRLKVNGKNITVIGSGDLVEVEKIIEEIKPDMLFIDSIQAVVDSEYAGSPGSLKQVKKSGQKLTAIAKNTGLMVFISGQITKQGDIAGPKVLEHIVDAVIYMDYLDGDNRVVSAAKNRFGSCGDFVIYSLTPDGLCEIESLDAESIKEHRYITGQVSSCVRVGTRLMVVELQVLAVNSYFEYPLRRTSGFSRERLLMLTAIVEKHLGLKLGLLDIYLNISGGNKVTERVSDLGVAAAIYSSLRNIPVSSKSMFLGEVGLNGEVRPQQDVSERIKFAVRNNFEKVVLSGYGRKINETGIGLEHIKNISELKNNIIADKKKVSSIRCKEGV